MQLEHDALDFDAYGLDPAVEGPRWLEFLDGPLGQPVLTVWLAHGAGRWPVPGTPWVLVGTSLRDRFAWAMARFTDDRRELALTAMRRLVERTAPFSAADSDRVRLNYNRIVDRFADKIADQYADWPETSWDVDGHRVPAQVFTWAGAWAGFTVAVPRLAIVVMARNVSPDAIRLAKLTDGHAYHFDLQAPLPNPGVPYTSVTAALGELASVDNTVEMHEDQMLLIQQGNP